MLMIQNDLTGRPRPEAVSNVQLFESRVKLKDSLVWRVVAELSAQPYLSCVVAN